MTQTAMAEGWPSGLPETHCGQGSTIARTELVRRALPGLVQKYAIRTVVDAGAGDLNWIQRVNWDVEYTPYDLIPRHAKVRQADITRDVLPACDLILCRHVLNHLDFMSMREALSLFRQSARYLLATQVDGELPEQPGWHHYNLRPWLGEPLERIPDTEGTGCLALWPMR